MHTPCAWSFQAQLLQHWGFRRYYQASSSAFWEWVGDETYRSGARRLCREPARSRPQPSTRNNHFQVLDVGCGDGLIAYLIAEARPDIKLRGLDVLARDCSYIPTARF